MHVDLLSVLSNNSRVMGQVKQRTYLLEEYVLHSTSILHHLFIIVTII